MNLLSSREYRPNSGKTYKKLPRIIIAIPTFNRLIVCLVLLPRKPNIGDEIICPRL